jgi:uncharacterized membrane protein YhiD involved in acid resistance
MELLYFVLNVGTALGLGAILGLERQSRGHPSGLRTLEEIVRRLDIEPGVVAVSWDRRQ